MSNYGDDREAKEGTILRIILIIAAIVVIFILIGAIFGEGPVLILRLIFQLLGAFR